MSPWRMVLICLLIGLACGFLQPIQPQSAIATAALILAVWIAVG